MCGHGSQLSGVLFVRKSPDLELLVNDRVDLEGWCGRQSCFPACHGELRWATIPIAWCWRASCVLNQPGVKRNKSIQWGCGGSKAPQCCAGEAVCACRLLFLYFIILDAFFPITVFCE